MSSGLIIWSDGKLALAVMSLSTYAGKMAVTPTPCSFKSCKKRHSHQARHLSPGGLIPVDSTAERQFTILARHIKSPVTHKTYNSSLMLYKIVLTYEEFWHPPPGMSVTSQSCPTYCRPQ